MSVRKRDEKNENMLIRGKWITTWYQNYLVGQVRFRSIWFLPCIILICLLDRSFLDIIVPCALSIYVSKHSSHHRMACNFFEDIKIISKSVSHKAIVDLEIREGESERERTIFSDESTDINTRRNNNTKKAVPCISLCVRTYRNS